MSSWLVRHENDRSLRLLPHLAAFAPSCGCCLKLVWSSLATQADQEGWPSARFLASLLNLNCRSAAADGSNATSPKPG